MKMLFFTVFFGALFSLHAQNFINHYVSDCGYGPPIGPDPAAPIPTQIRFSCITEKDDNFLISGPMNAGQYYAINLLEVDASGAEIAMNLITLDDALSEVTPTGLLWVTEGANQYVIICGYTGELSYHSITDPNRTAHAFVLKYDYVANNVVWISKIWSNWNAFIDIAVQSDGNYLLSGQYSNSVVKDTEDAFLYSANNSNGSLSKIAMAKALTSSSTSDTWYGLAVSGNNVYMSKRFEYYTSGGALGMRPGISKYNLSSNLLTDKNYIKHINEATDDARLYGVDIIKSGSFLYTAIHGNFIDDNNTDKDLFVVKANASDLSTVWQTRLNVPATAQDGVLHSIKTTPISGTNYDPIVFGNNHNNTRAFLFRMAANGASVTWWNEYENIYAPESFNFLLSQPESICPNSMIVSGPYIYAVGWFNNGQEDVGALLKTHINEGTVDECDIPTTAYIINYEIEDNPTPIQPNITLYNTIPDISLQACYTIESTPCFETRQAAQEPSENNIWVDNSSPNELIFTIPEFNENHVYSLEVYNLLGQFIRKDILTNQSGKIQLESGVYIYQLKINYVVSGTGKILVK